MSVKTDVLNRITAVIDGLMEQDNWDELQESIEWVVASLSMLHFDIYHKYDVKILRDRSEDVKDGE